MGPRGVTPESRGAPGIHPDPPRSRPDWPGLGGAAGSTRRNPDSSHFTWGVADAPRSHPDTLAVAPTRLESTISIQIRYSYLDPSRVAQMHPAVTSIRRASLGFTRVQSHPPGVAWIQLPIARIR